MTAEAKIIELLTRITYEADRVAGLIVAPEAGPAKPWEQVPEAMRDDLRALTRRHVAVRGGLAATLARMGKERAKRGPVSSRVLLLEAVTDAVLLAISNPSPDAEALLFPPAPRTNGNEAN